MNSLLLEDIDKKDVLREGMELMVDLQLKELEKYVKDD